jgi:hypothetical protein
MPILIDKLTTSEKCAIYNDLSHINPLYLTPQNYKQKFYDDEILYHKRNLMLLSLYFDKIIICTDNILAFTRFLSKHVVSSVVMAPWFAELVEHGVIVLAGWGTSIRSDMMKNQVEYSALYRPELKDKGYIEFLSRLSDRATWVVREPGPGEREHINYLRPLVQSSEGPFDTRDISFLTDLIEETNETAGYVGTMEMFPFVDALYGDCAEKSDSFYSSYYTSWHAYCAVHYAPAIPIHTSRIKLPHAPVVLRKGETPVLATLYSPDLFERYLVQRFGAKLFSKILAVDVKQLVAIRNGDWARFKSRYHEYLTAASSVCWVALHPQAHELIADDRIMDELMAEIFRAAPKDADLSALSSAIVAVLGMIVGLPVLGSVVQVFKTQINRRMGRMVNSVAQREIEPYLKKLRRVLEKPLGDMVIAGGT